MGARQVARARRTAAWPRSTNPAGSDGLGERREHMHFFVGPSGFGFWGRKSGGCGSGCGTGERHTQEAQAPAEEQSPYRRGARGTLRFMAHRLNLDDAQVAK